MVCDTDAIYLPPRRDQKTGMWSETLAPQTVPGGFDLPDYLELAVGLGVGFDGRDLGQLWLTPRLSDHLGLDIDLDVTAEVNSYTDQAPLERKTSRALFRRMNTAAAPLVARLQAAGWKLTGNVNRDTGASEIRPRFRLTRDDGRAFVVVLAAFSAVWDPGDTGPDGAEHPLPDSAEDPEGYAWGLALRVGALSDLLRVQWQATAGSTGATLFDSIDHQHELRGPGVLPPMEGLVGSEIEPGYDWWRTLSESELDAQPYLVRFDVRAAWLVRAGGADLGYGQPKYHAEADAAEVITKAGARGKLPSGLWRCELPLWSDASMPPPFPGMAMEDPRDPGRERGVVRRWITTPTLRLLVQDLGLTVRVVEAWVWPQQGRLLYTWYTRLRDALVEARGFAAQEFAAAREGGADAQLHRTTAEDWSAVAESVKRTYAIYIRMLDSQLSLATNERYRHHYQPLWRNTIRAEARRMDWLKAWKHGQATGRWPVAAGGTDEWLYLAATADTAAGPDVDTGELGKMRMKTAPVRITAALRSRLLGGMSPLLALGAIRKETGR